MDGEQTWNRLDLAQEQLELAVTLFLERRSHAAVITLAGAAERVFGDALAGGKQPRNLDWQWDQWAPLAHWLAPYAPQTKHALTAEQNAVFDALRHWDRAPTIELVADLEAAACWMLVRAFDNAQRLGRTVAGYDAFNDWFVEHVVGL
ncbi:hypothetical protein [Burkholderia vietnamiensis]|uniref:hypothetical protein n=1 Tax=Burkholderia vietnamiensis TaxID=60552 RepID=UPI002655DEDC|nr:hypothetical protein [Burkholderia vietnamiensis]MDN7926933.1 hypothetical protein [Burkholderia vietnamiensis]